MDNKYLVLERDFYIKLKVELSAFKSYALSNLGVIITTLYFVGSLAGLMYLKVLLARFGVNVFNHIELSDYLLALLSNGVIMAAFAIYLVVFVGAMKVVLNKEQKVKKNTKFNRFLSVLSMPFYVLPPLFSLVLASIIALFFYSWDTAVYDARDIRDGSSEVYNVTLTYPVKLNGQDFSQLSNVALVTSTTANAFIYTRDSKQLIIVPHSNIAALVPQLKQINKTKKTENSKESSVNVN